ncbi:hypothetical protein FV242_05740 [Methylobacterium sp. WL64]|uniref:hypothetical protein n=1 Tax=Methylobacterium sp. WL64 TaxID=2603894 RepID=UPI0011C9105E|nr:hypothetical protein [Methylobacterium sp. WL64]TXN04856.1 hypothetical protein FV242_05740 [Methylobacterium sp. WL64]
MSVNALRSLRDGVEAAVLDQRVEPSLATGVYAYVSALLRLAEDGDRDPELAVGEGRAAVGFLRAVPRLPAARARTWSPS